MADHQGGGDQVLGDWIPGDEPARLHDGLATPFSAENIVTTICHANLGRIETAPEERFVSFGVLRDVVVVLVHADRDGDMHVISLRKAEPYETRAYLEAARKFQGEGD